MSVRTIPITEARSPAPDPPPRAGGRVARSLGWTIGVYLASRLLLLCVAIAVGGHEHVSLIAVLGRWDGSWYAQIARSGYPVHVPQHQSALGFFPLLPLVIWLIMHLPAAPNSPLTAGVVVAGLGGLLATMLVQRLASGWWGKQAGARAVVLFCFFPGSIVFSMVYGEALLIPLAAGCILALERRRWLLAGALAGLASAVQPDALALVCACAITSMIAFREHGWRDHQATATLPAPLLSLTGISAFAIFLWARTGTPFANLDAQRDAWGEKVNPLALVHQVQDIWHQLAIADADYQHLNLAPVAGLLGAIVLIAGLALLLKPPRTVSLPGLTWTLAIAILALISENVAPSPRILITAFPAVLAFAHRWTGARFACLIAASTTLLVLSSALTYGGHTLTP